MPSQQVTKQAMALPAKTWNSDTGPTHALEGASAPFFGNGHCE